MNKITTRPDKLPSLNKYYPDLSETDRALIMRAYNKWRTDASTEIQGPEAHFGLLPFISMQKIGSALTWMIAHEATYQHIWAKLCSKVEAARWAKGSNNAAHCSWELILVNASVHQHFGRRPDLGVQIPTIPKETTRGPLKWNIGAKEWRPEKIQAAPRITLIKLRDLPINQPRGKGRGVWVLHAPTRYKQLAIGWLMDHCA